MSGRSVLGLVATLAALFVTVGAAVLEVTAQGDADVLEWARRNPDVLAWVGLGASVVAAILAFMTMRSRAKEEYQSHWRPHGP